MSFDQPSPRFRFAMLSSVGRVRAGNEDYCAVSAGQRVFVVCDGMGGAAAGEIASELAATTFLKHLEGEEEDAKLGMTDRLELAAAAANTAVFGKAQRSHGMHGMGTTLVALRLEASEAESTKRRRLWLAHVGDSRCYRMRAGKLTQMTEDHSLVQEQIRAGQLTPEQAERSPMRNIITRAIGSAPRVQADVSLHRTAPGDVYLLASDGLTRELSDAEIARCLLLSEGLEARCAVLVEAANAAGGHDNVTVLLLAIDT